MTNYSARYRDRLLDAEAWFQTGEHLLEAAEMVSPKVDAFWEKVRGGAGWDDQYVAIYFMLAAFGLENLLKAQIVRKRRAEIGAAVAARTRLPQVMLTHDLHQLAVEAGFPGRAAANERLLRSLTRSSEWYGRYPLPVSPGDLDPMVPSRSGANRGADVAKHVHER
jgi:hypothetical protein